MKNEKPTILIVDDDPDLLATVQDILTFTGQFRVFTAQSGTEAFGKARNLNIDALVTDFRMPTMNGVELVDVLRSARQFKNLPILFLSGSPEDIRSEVSKKQFVDVLAKPFDAEDLIGRLNSLVQKRLMATAA